MEIRLHDRVDGRPKPCPTGRFLEFLLGRFGAMLLAVGLCPVLVGTSRAQALRIEEAAVDDAGRPWISLAGTETTYYVLRRGYALPGITDPVAIATGSSRVVLRDEEVFGGFGGARFYRVQEISTSAPLDVDGDGLDDLFEFRHSPTLSPLLSGDASEDPDGDGRHNLREYREGTNPLIADTPSVGGFVLEPIPEATTAQHVTLRGKAPGQVSIRVEGGPRVVTRAVGDQGAVEVMVPLASNRLNRLLVSTTDSAGRSGSPHPIDVIQDSSAPETFVDFPSDGAETSETGTLVAGRVGDALSGFRGLLVWVQSSPSEGEPPTASTSYATDSPWRAEVDAGIGPNGTFARLGVPLIEGTNVVSVLAADVLGNRTVQRIRVVRVPRHGDRMVAAGGDGQRGRVLGKLDGPLVVRVLRSDGVPVVGKLVTFEVTKSDGRVRSEDGTVPPPVRSPSWGESGALVSQVMTDARGEARVGWTLGGDAGCGNNRVRATSQGIPGAVFFCASATAEPPSQINVGSGNHQKAGAGALTMEPLRAWVSDGCNPSVGIPVSFTVRRGNGRLHPEFGSGPGDPGRSSLVVTSGISGHASVRLRVGEGGGTQEVEVSFPGNTNGVATFLAYGLASDPGRPGTFDGIVMDNAQSPIGNAYCELTVSDFRRSTFTDAKGVFRFADVPAGPGHLRVDGATATSVFTNSIPTNTFPALSYSVLTVANARNSLPGPVLLPRLDGRNARGYAGTNDLVLTVEGIEGLRMTIAAGSMRHPNGQRVTPESPAVVSLNQVHHDDVPMPMPDGASPPFAWTLQPGGATFDPPIRIEYPNMSGLPPGAVAYFLSFDHGTERFEIVSSGHVTADGSTIVTDANDGLHVAGWGCNCPPYSVTAECVRDADSEPQNRLLDWIAGAFGDTEPGVRDPCPPQDPSCPRPCEKTDPIRLFSGEMYLDVEDLRIPGRGFDFVWSRHYRSKMGPRTAMGPGWDFSYNLRLELGEDGFYVCDGQGRRDLYRADTDGTWCRPEFFRSLRANPDGTHTLVHADQFRWNFGALDGGPSQGRITSMRDRNGNEMRFGYDAAGRLVRVTDTLDRDITVRYSPAGLVESVTDFVGRTIRYARFAPGESGGGPEDLRAVTRVPVTGTPTGNDFPDGKTTSYTYSTGFADDRLNHNLLTVADGRSHDPGDPAYASGAFLTNVYSATVDPGHPDFDRVVRQHWGGGTIDLHYLPIADPTMEREYAVIRTIVNDRVGNVSEHFFDRRNRLVIRRDFTGRAVRDRPTTESENRPGGKLRRQDPDYFETRYVWNEEGLLRWVRHPGGERTSYTYEYDIDTNAPPRFRANLRRIRRMPAPVREDLASPEPGVITEEFDYASDYSGGGCCGFNFVSRHVDPRGEVTRHRYDAAGNRVSTSYAVEGVTEDFEYDAYGRLTARVHPADAGGRRRRDEYEYHGSGIQRGYLHREIRDAANLRSTTTFEYDALGHRIRRVDPRGHDERWIVNALGQVVRHVTPEEVAGSGIRSTNDFHYDANDNLVRISRSRRSEEAGGGGDSVRNPAWETRITYDALNHPLRVSTEVEADRFVAEEFVYDLNRNRIAYRKGEATAGRQPDNVVAWVYDERDRPFQQTDGAGGSDASTTQFDYDAQGGLVALWRGLEGSPRLTRLEYDGFRRVALVIDPMGNTIRSRFDASGNVIGRVFEGESNDEPSQAGNRRLEEEVSVYDGMNRRILRRVLRFDPRTQEPLGDGDAETRYEYAANSRLVRVVDDNGNARSMTYDSADRVSTLTDPAGNRVTYGHDPNGNVVSVESREVSDLGEPEQTYRTLWEYDPRNRRISSTDDAGSVTRWGVDSRGNLIREEDALGNVVVHEVDGLDRRTKTTRILTDSGIGTGNRVGGIVTRREWDDSSRLVAEVDDNLIATRYAYDGLDRRVRVTYGDGTGRVHGLDVHHDLVRWVDANGSVVSNRFDLNGRLIGRVVSPGRGVRGDTTRESYRYDGRGLWVEGSNDKTRVIRAFDSQGRLLEEGQEWGGLSTATFRSGFDGVGNRLTTTYPSGRVVERAYDVLDRLVDHREQGQSVVAYDYGGPGRVLRRRHANGTRMEYSYDGLRRVASTVHGRGDVGAAFDSRTYGWDRVHNQVAHDEAGGSRRAYRYDSAYRMAESLRDGATAVAYRFDGVQNRSSVSGGVEAGTYTMSSALPEPADAQVNQYTTTPSDTRRADANGNLVEIVSATGTRVLGYDFADRLVDVRTAGGELVGEYVYDVLGRRVAKTANGTTRRFLYDGPQPVEEADEGGATVRDVVFGVGLNEAVRIRTAGLTVFLHQDHQYSVRAVSGATGEILETLDYSDYGRPAARGPSLTPFMFTGHRYDEETGLYFARRRYFDPGVGRFVSADPIGRWADVRNFGNGFAAVANNPASWMDPWGLSAETCGDTGFGGDALYDALKMLRQFGALAAAAAERHFGKEWDRAVRELRDVVRANGGRTLMPEAARRWADELTKGLQEAKASKDLMAGVGRVLKLAGVVGAGDSLVKAYANPNVENLLDATAALGSMIGKPAFAVGLTSYSAGKSLGETLVTHVPLVGDYTIRVIGVATGADQQVIEDAVDRLYDE